MACATQAAHADWLIKPKGAKVKYKKKQRRDYTYSISNIDSVVFKHAKHAPDTFQLNLMIGRFTDEKWAWSQCIKAKIIQKKIEISKQINMWV